MKNILLPFLLLILTTPLIGQPIDNVKVNEYMDYERPRELTIVDIEVTGVKFLQTNYLVNISGLSIGQEITIPGEDITDAIEKFWALGLFADVRIIARKIEGRAVYLEIQLTEQPLLNK